MQELYGVHINVTLLDPPLSDWGGGTSPCSLAAGAVAVLYARQDGYAVRT